MDSSPAVDLRGLIQKLGHSIEDIQKRALENILSKLQYNIVTIEDLLHYKDLYSSLFMFLNEHKEEEKVLKLIQQLTQFSNGAKHVISLGGVEFFALYREDVSNNEKLVEIADQISEQLFYLHDDEAELPSDISCNQTSSNVIKDKNVEYIHNACASLLQSYQYQKSLGKINDDTTTQHETEFELNNIQISSTSMLTSKAEESEESIFQWIPLTSGDRQILSVTDSRLQSASPTLILQSCEFFKFILLHDFPAEVFIQRPNILKSLLAVLSIHKTNNLDIVENILSSLLKLSKKLFSRFLQNKDVDIWQKQFISEDIQSLSISTNQTQSSSLTSKLSNDVPDDLTSVSDQRTTTFENSISVEPSPSALQTEDDMESEVLSEAFQQARMHLDEFITTMLLSTIELFALYQNNDKLFTVVTSLVTQLVTFLKAVGLKTSWSLSDKQSKTNVHSMMAILRKYNDTVTSMLHKSESETMEDGKMQELKLVVLWKQILRFLHVSVPKDKIYQVLGEESRSFLFDRLSHVSLKRSLPRYWRLLENVLTSIDDRFLDDYKEAKRLVASCKAIDDFIGLFGDNEGSNASDQKLMEHFKMVIPGLTWHCHEQFIHKTIAMCSERYIKAKENKEQWTNSLLEIFQHEEKYGLRIAFKSTLEFLKEAFSDSLVSSPLSIKHQKAFVFIQKKFLLLFCKSCYHKDKQIANTCKNIISLLIQSQLNMSAKAWQQTLDILPTILPLFHGLLASKEDSVFDSIMDSMLGHQQSIIDANGRVTGLSPFEKFKSSLRLMNHRSQTVRRKGFAYSLTYLTNHDQDQDHVISYTKYTNLYTAEDLMMFNGIELGKFRPNADLHFDSITDDNVIQLWKVLKDETVQETLRQSVLDQLAVILQDCKYHPVLMDKNNYRYILKLLRIKVEEEISEHWTSSTFTSKKFVLPLLKILKHLTYWQTSLRHVLSVERDLYYQLFQILLMCGNDYEMRYYASSMMCLMLYDEFLSMKKVEGETPTLQIENSVLMQTKLPLNFSTITTKIGNRTYECLKRKEMVQFIKNSCYAQCQWLRGKMKIDDLTVSPDLRLTDSEVNSLTSLSFSNITSCVIKAVKTKPTNHFTAMESIESFKLLLMAYKSDIESDEGDQGSSIEDIVSIFEDGFLKQVLDTQPESMDDHALFRCVISLFNTVIQCEYKKDIPSFDHYLMCPTIIKMITGSNGQPLDSSIVKEQRFLKQCITTCISSSLNSNKGNGNTASKTNEEFLSRCCDTIQAIYKNLSITGSESYYDLPLMEFMMECMMHLTSNQGWSLNIEEGCSLCLEMFNWLSQVLVSFHMDRVGAAISFMGKGIVQKCVLCLCHLLHEIQAFSGAKDWAQGLISDSDLSTSVNHSPTVLPSSPLPWLLPLLSDRMIDVRYCGWAVSSALVTNTTGQEIVVNEFQTLPGGLWAASLGVILDKKECYAVRAQASCLLSHLIRTKTYQPNESEEKEESNSLWNSIVVHDTSIKMEVSGVKAFLLLLDHFEFFNEIRYVFTTTNNKDSSTFQINASTSMQRSEESQDTSNRLSKNSSTSVSEVKMENSELLKRTLLHLLRQLINLSPRIVFQKLFENQVFNTILRSHFQGSSGVMNAEVFTLLRQLWKHDKTQWCSVIEQHALLDKIRELMTKEISVNLGSFTVGLQIWRSAVEFFCVAHRNESFKPWFHQHALELLYSLSRFLNTLEITKKSILPTFESVLRLIMLLLQDTVSRDEDVPLVDKPYNYSMFHNQETDTDRILCVGELLCQRLILLWCKSYHLNTPSLIGNTLKCLFMCSDRAKEVALGKGLVETLVEEVKDRLVKLKIESAIGKSKEKQVKLLDDLRSIFEVVRNFMLQGTNVKLGFLNNNIVAHLQNVWTWSIIHGTLRLELLHVLIVISAHCREACVALSTTTSLPQKQSIDDPCLISQVLKQLFRSHNEALAVHGKQATTLRPILELLTNCVSVSEFRTLLIKANTPQLFEQCYQLTKTGNNHQKKVANLLLFYWLRLYACASCYDDSIKFIGKIPDLPSTLLSLVNQNNIGRRKKEFSLMILRNLMFVSNFKQTLSCNISLVIFRGLCQDLLGYIGAENDDVEIACFISLPHDHIRQ
uniref:Rotatin N-terminal domain-containing protein n=1 Tax=Clytia hemisphaerica TaxID=252671 RepID=A0A7M5VH40_9CNID